MTPTRNEQTRERRSPHRRMAADSGKRGRPRGNLGPSPPRRFEVHDALLLVDVIDDYRHEDGHARQVFDSPEIGRRMVQSRNGD